MSQQRVEDRTLREGLREIGRTLARDDFVFGSAGNVSARRSADTFLVTARGIKLGMLMQDDIVECAVSSAAALSPAARTPSKEAPMHAAIYRLRPDIHAVLHASPFYSTLAACSEVTIPADLFVENMYYLERVARIPYYHPGSAALADAVGNKAADCEVFLLEHHGVLACGENLQEALTALQTLELTCRMLVTARSAGLPLASLSPDVVADFLAKSGYRQPRRRP